MARKHKTEPTRNTGIRLGDLLAEHTGTEPEPEPEPEPKKPTKDKLTIRVDSLKTKAAEEKVPWTSDLEQQLRACKTAGAVRRLWRDHRIKHGA